MTNGEFIEGGDYIWYGRALDSIKKSTIKLQPIYEAFTNSLESVVKNAVELNPYIKIRLYHLKTTVTDIFTFDKIEIEDNGHGFNEDNFGRFKRFGDDRKSSKNRGLGRVQLIHYFNTCKYHSVFNENGNFKERNFILSKSPDFLKNNSIIKHFGVQDTPSFKMKTIVTLLDILDNSDLKYYNELTSLKLKKLLISHYLQCFCIQKSSLPLIEIDQYYNEEKSNEEFQQITGDDIPDFDKEQPIIINYSKISDNGKSVNQTEKTERLNLTAFKISSDKLEENAIKLTVKSEIVENKQLKLENLATKDQIENNRYLFLLSGEYFDSLDGNTRGDFVIPTEENFKAKYADSPDFFSPEVIIIETIITSTNKLINSIYPEINKKVDEYKNDLEKLKSMFLLSDETLNTMKLSLNDTEEDVLGKMYKADSITMAKTDAKMKSQIDKLDSLNPNDEKYEKEFSEIVTDIVKEIPLRNRTALTRYIAHRKLILELFAKILYKKLTIQKTTKRNIDEKLLHNLIFQQTNESPELSDLWIINEDFIYFNGTSDKSLGNISVNGVKVLKESLTKEEQQYRDSLGEDKYDIKPDVLLFPDEGKCIIVEFKNPDKNVSDHLLQITNYASILRNLSKDQFQFTTFYGYYIGEKIEASDIQNKDPYFENAYNLDYVYRPHFPIRGQFGRTNGSLYTEAIKYSTLLERAKNRNKMFINKITEKISDKI